MLNELPIGMFDSGVGGLTVMDELMRVLPHERILYLGDTARLPYGNKSPDAIVRFSLENARYLCQQGIKLLVVACNTASAHALEVLEHELPIPVVGVILPGVSVAVSQTKSRNVAVLGTRGTIASASYQKALEAALPGVKVHSIACPLFVPLVEEGLTEHPAAELIITDYLRPLNGTLVDTLILGCTHYPLLRKAISKQLGEGVSIINSASACALEVKQRLQDHQLLATQSCKPHCFYVSDDPQGFSQLGSVILNSRLTTVIKI